MNRKQIYCCLFLIKTCKYKKYYIFLPRHSIHLSSTFSKMVFA